MVNEAEFEEVMVVGNEGANPAHDLEYKKKAFRMGTSQSSVSTPTAR